jgi:quercetin dioxygenase-like cupin family protein
MNRIVKIFETASLVIERFDHRPDCVHRDHDKEMTTDAAVTFVQSGSFTLLEGKTSWTFRPGDVLLSTPGTVRRYRHFEECPSDVCLRSALRLKLSKTRSALLPGRLLLR